MQRRVSGLLLVWLLATTLLPGLAAADNQLSLSDAISLARQAFPEVSFPGEFTSNFSETDGQGVWYLRWYSNADKYSEVSINLDALSGEIIGFNIYQEPDPNQEYAALPALSQAECLRVAEAFLQRIIAEKYEQCVYQQQAPPRPFLSRRNWAMRYSYQFIRQVNDLACPANGITVEVDGDTGQVTFYSLRWNDLQFPAPERAISADQAAQVLKEKGALELQYIWPMVARGETAQPMLAYVYPNINNVYINAITGELENESYIVRAPDSAQLQNAKWAGDMAYTPQEWAEIEYVKGLLTEKQAEDRVRELLNIPGVRLNWARLTKDVSFPDLRTWQFSLYSKPSAEYYDVRIDAKTGELLHVSHSWSFDDTLQEGTLNWEEARQAAESFMAKYNPEKAQQVKLVAERQERTEQNPLSYHFNYRRIVHGVPFPANYIDVSIRAEGEGLLTNYDVRWVDSTFPDPTTALTKADAYNQLLVSYPLRKEYRLIREIDNDKTSATFGQSQSQAVLSYRLTETMTSLFSADQMLPIDYRGRVIKPQETGLPQDIEDSFARDEIAFLAQVGIIQLENGLFYPHEAMCVGGWLEMLSRAAGWTTDDPIIGLPQWAKAAEGSRYLGAARAAIAAGLIRPGENLDMSRELTREQLALFAVRALGYEKVAAIPGIYRLDCQDAPAVDAAYIGHVAIARGLDILVGDNVNFRPQATASRAECAAVIMRMLRLER